jgi:hypothetical protein
MMGIYAQVAIAAQFEVQNTMLGEEGEHVIEECEACADGGFARAINP